MLRALRCTLSPLKSKRFLSTSLLPTKRILTPKQISVGIVASGGALLFGNYLYTIHKVTSAVNEIKEQMDAEFFFVTSGRTDNYSSFDKLIKTLNYYVHNDAELFKSYMHKQSWKCIHTIQENVLKYGDVAMIKILEQNSFHIHFTDETNIKIIADRNDLELFQYAVYKLQIESGSYGRENIYKYLTNVRFYDYLVQRNLLREYISPAKRYPQSNWNLLYQIINLKFYPKDKLLHLLDEVTKDKYKDIRNKSKEGKLLQILLHLNLEKHRNLDELFFVSQCSPITLYQLKDVIKTSPNYDTLISVMKSINKGINDSLDVTYSYDEDGILYTKHQYVKEPFLDVNGQKFDIDYDEWQQKLNVLLGNQAKEKPRSKPKICSFY